MTESKVKIILTKLETLKDAAFPQEAKYPSKTTKIYGSITNQTLPEVGKAFYVSHVEFKLPIFHTSVVKDIENIDNNTMILTTTNSKYKLEIIEK